MSGGPKRGPKVGAYLGNEKKRPFPESPGCGRRRRFAGVPEPRRVETERHCPSLPSIVNNVYTLSYIYICHIVYLLCTIIYLYKT